MNPEHWANCAVKNVKEIMCKKDEIVSSAPFAFDQWTIGVKVTYILIVYNK